MPLTSDPCFLRHPQGDILVLWVNDIITICDTLTGIDAMERPLSSKYENRALGDLQTISACLFFEIARRDFFTWHSQSMQQSRTCQLEKQKTACYPVKWSSFWWFSRPKKIIQKTAGHHFQFPELFTEVEYIASRKQSGFAPCQKEMINSSIDN